MLFSGSDFIVMLIEVEPPNEVLLFTAKQFCMSIPRTKARSLISCRAPILTHQALPVLRISSSEEIMEAGAGREILIDGDDEGDRVRSWRIVRRWRLWRERRRALVQSL